METPNSSLGITTKSASLPLNPDRLKKAISEMYELQSYAKELMPEHRVCICCRFLAHDSNEVKVVYRSTKRTVSFKGLARCASVWICPVCGNVISEKRKSELKRATQKHPGDVLMVTYTVAHGYEQGLSEVLELLKSTFRCFMSGSFGEDFREKYGCIGTVRALEITHGASGWHPHFHQLMFVKKTSDAHVRRIATILKGRWVTHVQKNGGYATAEHGIDVKKDADFLADYITKFGHAPQSELWGVEHELSKTVSKKGRNGGRSPLQLLRDYGDGDARSGRLFQEYAHEVFGNSQLVWSRGLKEHFDIGIETDSEVLENDEKDGNFTILATISGVEWRVVRKLKLQAVVLNYALSGDKVYLEQKLVELGIRGNTDVE